MRSRTRAALFAAVLAGWLNPAAGQTPPPPPPVPTATPQAAPCPAPVTNPTGLSAAEWIRQLTAQQVTVPGCSLTREAQPVPCPACPTPDSSGVKAAVVHQLRNTAAADVAHALKSHFGENRGVTVVAEPVSNTLLVSADPAQLQRVMKIVTAMAQAPPQVVLTTTFMEARGGFLEKTGLCPAGETGCGKAWTLTDREHQMFNAWVRQGKQDGVIEVLARPQVQVMDNQTGFVQVGGQHPCPAPASDGKAGIEYSAVGFTAKMTPRISPDGTVLVRVEASHTSPCPGRGVTLTSGGETVTVPAFNTESVQTTVCLSDGATAVLGAGTQTRAVAQELRTPVMSDIPCVGRLFTNVAISTEKSQLLLVVTAHVVRTGTEVVPPAASPAPVTTARPFAVPLHAPQPAPVAPVVVPTRPYPTPPFPVPVVAQPCPAPATAVAGPVGLTRPAPVVAPAPVPATVPSPRPTPACCEAACGACEKAKAAELVKAYHKACAAGDKDAATRCAVQALAIDPTCFGTAPAK